jgi:hypothetical protein
MSKIGKKYTLKSGQASITKAAGDFIRNNNLGLTITDFQENFNNSKLLYEGKITFSGQNKNIKKLDTRIKDILPFFKVVDTKFDIDTHYEELREINLSRANRSLRDSTSLLKYNGPLEYNFLIKNYEDFLNANPSISETALPYFFAVLADFVKQENYLGFEGTSFFETPSATINKTYNNEPETRVMPSVIELNNKKLSLDAYLQKFNVYKEQFPFYADITFDTHELDERSITTVLHNKNLLTGLMQEIVLNATPTQLFYSDTESINARVYNIENYLRKQLDASMEGDFTFIFDMNQRIDNKSRTFMEVLNGEREYVEVIGYHLRKYNGNTTTLLQEWYFPNITDGQMNWIDSQIKYNKLYTYKLDLVVLSFSTEYQFTEYEYYEDKIVANFINRPVIKAFILEDKTNNPKESLGSSYTNRLLDYPPIEPEMEIIPFIGIPDRIKLNFNTGIGYKTIPSVDFSPEEDIKKDILRDAQNKNPHNPLLTFQSDEPAKFIDVFKTTEKPTSYGDFFGNLLQVLDTNGTGCASFIDNIEPNKKYYYIARCVDFHDNVSNPTPVYEVEIQQDGGLVVPIIKVVEFSKKESLKQESKQFKRYIKIQPAIRHRMPNEEKTDINNIELGTDKETPWNKNFKLRLTSKSTGKKIDINFTFKYNKPS